METRLGFGMCFLIQSKQIKPERENGKQALLHINAHRQLGVSNCLRNHLVSIK